MAKKWTLESAKAYVNKVQKGRQQIGLTYWSAVDFLTKMNQPKIKVSPNDTTEDDA